MTWIVDDNGELVNLDYVKKFWNEGGRSIFYYDSAGLKFTLRTLNSWEEATEYMEWLTRKLVTIDED